MKIHSVNYRFLTFLTVLVFCALPPLFTKQSPDTMFLSWNFPWQTLGLALFSMVLIFLSKDLSSPFHVTFLKQILYGLSVFLVLNVFAFFFRFLSNHFSDLPETQFHKPGVFSEYIFCILNFLFSAFYEETVYRFFIPECLSKLISEKIHNRRLCFFITEGTALLLFALGHMYLGFLSVLNAAFAYIVLRFVFRKSGSLLPGTSGHFAYNLFQLFISPL